MRPPAPLLPSLLPLPPVPPRPHPPPETRSAAYLVDPDTLATLQQVEPADGLPGDLTTAHPKRTPDGRLVNFSRSLPFGGYHVYVQDPASLKRTQIAFIR